MRSKHPEALKLSEKIKIMKPKMAGALLQGLKPIPGEVVKIADAFNMCLERKASLGPAQVSMPGLLQDQRGLLGA